MNLKYVYNIGDRIKDEKRDLTVLEQVRYAQSYNDKQRGFRTVQRKAYKVWCHKCGWKDGIILESNLIKKKHGCSCCSNQIIVPGINDLVTNGGEWLIPYFPGGIKQAQQYSPHSTRPFYPKCPNCGKIRNSKTNVVNLINGNGFVCECTSGRRKGERFVASFLDHIGVNYIRQASRTDLNWIKDKSRYDFFIPKFKTMIQVHGPQHYIPDIYNGQDLQKIQRNDQRKEQIAIENGIEHYVILDYRKCTMEFLKDSIMGSELFDIFGVLKDTINWDYIFKDAESSIIKKMCNAYDNGQTDLNVLAEKFQVYRNTVIVYLNRGKQLGLLQSDFDLSQNIQHWVYKQDGSLVFHEVSQEKTLLKFKQIAPNIRFGRKRLSNIRDTGVSYEGYYFYTYPIEN